MSKKPNPKAAFSQTLTPAQKAHYEHSLVFAADMGMTYLFSNPAATVAIVNPAYNFGSFKDFAAKADERLLEQFHGMAFGEPPTKADRQDIVEWQVKVWMRLCETAANRLSSPKNPGERKQSAKMLNRSYELVKTEIDANLKLPPQAKTCLAFFTECAAKDEAYQKIPVEERGVFTIKEDAFKKYVEQEAARLQTRQDPWRIFQYYRPELIKNGFIRLV